jgi:hypothetical protein
MSFLHPQPYSPCALFRWVDHGFQQEEDYYASLSKEEAVADELAMQHHWTMGLGLFSTLDDLRAKSK